MKNFKLHIIGFSLLLFSLSCQSLRRDKQVNNLPVAVGLVNDFEDILTTEEEQMLQARLQKVSDGNKVQIAIVTTDTFHSYLTLDSFSLALARFWGIGYKEHNKGVLIAVSKANRKVRIQNSDAIMTELTNEETTQIIDQTMLPKFKQDSFYTGLDLGLSKVLKEISIN